MKKKTTKIGIQIYLAIVIASIIAVIGIILFAIVFLGRSISGNEINNINKEFVGIALSVIVILSMLLLIIVIIPYRKLLELRKQYKDELVKYNNVMELMNNVNNNYSFSEMLSYIKLHKLHIFRIHSIQLHRSSCK